MCMELISANTGQGALSHWLHPEPHFGSRLTSVIIHAAPLWLWTTLLYVCPCSLLMFTSFSYISWIEYSQWYKVFLERQIVTRLNQEVTWFCKSKIHCSHKYNPIAWSYMESVHSYITKPVLWFYETLACCLYWERNCRSTVSAYYRVHQTRNDRSQIWQEAKQSADCW